MLYKFLKNLMFISTRVLAGCIVAVLIFGFLGVLSFLPVWFAAILIIIVGMAVAAGLMTFYEDS